jgi:hypothetical protein
LPSQLANISKEISAATIADRRNLVGKIYPRLLYLFSDVICCPFMGSAQDEGVIDILVFSSLAAARSVNRALPSLIIIFNKRNINECKPYLYQTGDSDFSDVIRSTVDWMDAHPRAQQLQQMFKEVFVVHVPNFHEAQKH